MTVHHRLVVQMVAVVTMAFAQALLSTEQIPGQVCLRALGWEVGQSRVIFTPLFPGLITEINPGSD